MPVDREQKVIRGYKVMSIGEAIGHGMIVDDTTLSQLEALGNKSPGVKTRVQHPNGKGDGFGRYLGKSRNFKREGNSVFADLHLDDLAFKSPEGNWGDYVLNLAESAPDAFGSSPEVAHTKQLVGKSGAAAMRIHDLLAIAIVDRPATNAGFFSTPEGVQDMADTTALEAQVAELSAERDTATKTAGELKARVESLEAKIKEAAAAEMAELSAAKTEAIASTLKTERARVGDVLALCSKAQKIDLAAKFIADGTSVADVQATLFAALCAGAKPVGEGSGELHLQAGDENATYKKEYAALSAKERNAFGDEAGYIAMRRIDDGIDQLTTKVA